MTRTVTTRYDDEAVIEEESGDDEMKKSGTRGRRRQATPVAHMILSKRMADHRPHDMICELVDNAFDASARRVWIELSRRGIRVADDGTGMEDVNDAVRFGKGTKVQRRGGVLGRFGVGMTDALCKLGPRAEIVTLHAGGFRRLSVNWEECLRNDHFPFLDESRPRRMKVLEVAEGIEVESGTLVTIAGQRPTVQIEKLRRMLTQRYTPGIWQGREIFLRREGQQWISVEDMDPGPLVDTIEYDGEIDGLAYHVYGGLMVQRNVVYNRAFVGYAYRFIEDTTELFKGVSTAHMQIFLAEEWKECLGTHKNRLEFHREALFEDIQTRAKSWLAAASQKSEALQLTSLALELEDYLSKMARGRGEDGVARSAVGTAPDTTGDAVAKTRSRPRPRVPKPQQDRGEAGSTKASTRQHGISIIWDPALRQMGELRVADGADEGEGVSVALNPNDARVRTLRERRDCPGLVHIISAYIAQYAALSESNAKRVMRSGIVAEAEPDYRAFELFGYYYDRIDQPAVTHDAE